MDVLPAIDLRDGKVVRLSQGDYDRQTTYSDDPAGVAQTFAAAGAGWIHVVDLDAARSGRPVNTEAIGRIRRAVDCRIELGGGARSEEAIDAMLDAGADRVVVGSAAVNNWDWFESLLGRTGRPERLALGLDARDGRLAVHGWTDLASGPTAIELAKRVDKSSLGAIIYTDISRDGMLSGVNLASTGELVAATDVPIIASGGVSALEDVVACKRTGCGGVIIGRAWYEGRIDLAKAVEISKAP